MAGATTLIPLGGNNSNSVIIAEGYQAQAGESLVSPMRVVVTPGYFETMSTALVRGRYFTERDNDTAPPVIIVDERLARRFWPDADPIGKRMYQPTNPKDALAVDERTRFVTVVGVVREVQLEDLAGTSSAGAYYYPAAQEVPRGLTLAMKTAGDPEPVLAALRAELRRLDPEMPLFDVRPMSGYMARSLMPRQAAMALASSFGLVSLLLAAIGLYGVLAYLVSQRSREIGVRMALGSTTRAVVMLVFREGMLLVASGVVLGLIGAALLQSVLASELYGLDPMEPWVITLAGLVLSAIALVAMVLPARQAASVDPVLVLSR
jgi:predicted permease